MTNQFIISYPGNKRTDYKYFKDHIDYTIIKNIIEPFCGSGAISFNIWKDNPDKNFNYYLNDIDDKLYNIYKILKEEELKDIFIKINEIKNIIKKKEDFQNLTKKNIHTIYEYMAISKMSGIRYSLYHKRAISNVIYKPNKELILFSKFIKQSNVYISNDDFKILYDIHKDNKESLIILDPPYISSCNIMYAKASHSIYEYLYNDNIEYKKAKIILPLESNWIIDILFKKLKKIIEWCKNYNMTHKSVILYLLSN